MAAVLACGEGAALSHRSAASLWELRQTDRRDIDVTVGSRAGRSRAGITVHRSSTLTPDQVTTRNGIPVTTVARTLLDLTDVLDRRGVRRAVEQSERRHRFDLAAVKAVLAQANGRRNAGVLADAVRIYDPDSALTRSELEDAFSELCKAAGVPPPSVNDEVEGFEVDFSWPGHDLVVELDGHDTHGTREAFERDRRRDQVLTVAGRRVIRFTYRQVTEQAEDAVRVLRALHPERVTSSLISGVPAIRSIPNSMIPEGPPMAVETL
jgi:hypothetical protein